MAKWAKEWGRIAAVMVLLYATGVHVNILSTMQRTLLWTGFMDAERPAATHEPGPMLSTVDFSLMLENRAGEPTVLSDYRGNVLFINFWATWCPPCIAEMPTIASLHAQLKYHPNIRFLMISENRDRQKAHAFMKRKGYAMPYYFPASRLPMPLHHSVIPTTVVISRDGRIHYKREGIASYGSPAFRKWLIALADA